MTQLGEGYVLGRSEQHVRVSETLDNKVADCKEMWAPCPLFKFDFTYSY